MTEDDARTWIVSKHGEDSAARLAKFVEMVVAENERQNLISPATVDCIWSRHVVDSAQLLCLAPPTWQTWIDIGSGGGFPGLIVALLAPTKTVSLVEPRRKRADFLTFCCAEFELERTTVYAAKIEAVTLKGDVISARAVAPAENLLRTAGHCATRDTTWLLPRGRSGIDDAANLCQRTRTVFHVEHSITDAESMIVVLQGDGQ